MAELDIFGNSLEDLLGNALAAEVPSSNNRLYDYTNQRETGEASNLYWGNYSTQVTQRQLQELFNAEDNGQLREAFGSFDNYMAYMNERQDLIDAGELNPTWWDTGVALLDKETLADREAGMNDKELEKLIINQGAAYAEEAYNQQADVLNSLYAKYTGGENGTWYNKDGDKFRWNGTSFVKTAKVDDSFNVNSFILAMAATGMSASVAAGIANSLGGSISASLNLGEKATTALVNGLQNGLTTVGATALQGKQLSPEILADSLWGTLSPSVISALGITPDTFVSAFVDSLGSDVVKTSITGGDFDWKDMLVDAVISGGIESVKDFFGDWLSTKDKEDLYQHYLQTDYATFANMSPEEFENWLLTNPNSLFQTSDLGALVGPSGVLTKVFGFEGTADYISTAWFDKGVNTVTNFLGSLGVDKALAAINSILPKGEDDPFYEKGNPYKWDEEFEQWVVNGDWTKEEIDRWNQEFLYGGALDERYWHSWQERDPNSTVQGIWESPATPETGGLGGWFGSLIGTGGGLKISENALPGTGVPDPKGAWQTLIDTWNNFVDTKSPEEQASWASDNNFSFADIPPEVTTDVTDIPPEVTTDVTDIPPELGGTEQPPTGSEEPPAAGSEEPPAAGSMASQADYKGDIKGLSYQPQEVPGYISTNNIDAAAGLKQFVQSNLKQNSTMNSLFKELIG